MEAGEYADKRQKQKTYAPSSSSTGMELVGCHVKKDKRSSSLAYQVSIAFVFLFALLFTTLVFWVLDMHPSLVEDDFHIMLIGVSFLIFSTTFAWLSVQWLSSFGVAPKLSLTEKILVVIMIFATMTAIADFIITLHMIGFTRVGSFYLSKGEPYFNSLYGLICLAYDGSGHVILQFVCAYLILTGSEYKYVGLFYGADVFNSIFPLLLGAAGAGEHSKYVRPSTALNVPWILFPTAICIVCFKIKVSNDQKPVRSKTQQLKCHFIADLLFLIFFFAASLIYIIRALAVIDSQIPFVKSYVESFEPLLSIRDNYTTKSVVVVQSLQNFFYLMPLQLFLVYEILYRGVTGKPSEVLGKNTTSYSALLAGASFQSQFCVFLGMGCIDYHPITHTIPTLNPMVSWQFFAINTLLLIVPPGYLIYSYAIDQSSDRFENWSWLDNNKNNKKVN